MNVYLQDLATTESTTEPLTFEDGMEFAQEQFALESMFKDLDTFTGAMGLISADMNDATVEALSVALGAPTSAIVSLGTAEGVKDIATKVKDAIMKAIKAFSDWVKKHWKKSEAVLEKSSDEHIDYLKTVDGGFILKDNASIYFELPRDKFRDPRNGSIDSPGDHRERRRISDAITLGRNSSFLLAVDDETSVLTSVGKDKIHGVQLSESYGQYIMHDKEFPAGNNLIWDITVSETIKNYERHKARLSGARKMIEDKIADLLNTIEHSVSPMQIDNSKLILKFMKLAQKEIPLIHKAFGDYAKAVKLVIAYGTK